MSTPLDHMTVGVTEWAKLASNVNANEHHVRRKYLGDLSVPMDDTSLSKMNWAESFRTMSTPLDGSMIRMSRWEKLSRNVNTTEQLHAV